jgi:hypothetical protein
LLFLSAKTKNIPIISSGQEQRGNWKCGSGPNLNGRMLQYKGPPITSSRKAIVWLFFIVFLTAIL